MLDCGQSDAELCSGGLGCLRPLGKASRGDPCLLEPVLEWSLLCMLGGGWQAGLRNICVWLRSWNAGPKDVERPVSWRSLASCRNQHESCSWGTPPPAWHGLWDTSEAWLVICMYPRSCSPITATQMASVLHLCNYCCAGPEADTEEAVCIASFLQQASVSR